MAPKGFSEEVRKEICEAQRWVCFLCLNRIDDFHHKLSNTNANRKLFPRFLNSPFNCVGLCRGCHQDADIHQLMRIGIPLAAVYEHWLEEK